MAILRQGDLVMKDIIPLIDESLSTLKDFQTNTVKAVIKQFASNETNRILVGDEVGLGKTVVAKGVIAELLKLKLGKGSNKVSKVPFRVTYICSNLTLAEENRKKLAVFRGKSASEYVQEPSFGRLLELAMPRAMDSNVGGKKLLELCSLTPSTSFNLTNGDGNKKERAILFLLLCEHRKLAGYRHELDTFFRAGVGGWDDLNNWLSDEFIIDENIKKDFFTALDSEISEKESGDCRIDNTYCSWLRALLGYSKGEFRFCETKYEKRFRSYLRQMLARACARHITADLFILDEFQRFKSLLDSNVENDQSLIAREVLRDKRDTKVLLLSATPFKALSKVEEDEEGEAHAEELKFLLAFLSQSNQDILDEYEKDRMALHQQLLALRDDKSDVNLVDDSHKLAIESILTRYIARTERAQISHNYEGLFSNNHKVCREEFSSADIQSFKAIDRVGLAIRKVSPTAQLGQLLEFYKSAPWPMSFLSGYNFKKLIDVHRGNKDLHKALNQSRDAWLDLSKINNYSVELAKSPHAKTRALVKELFKTSSEKLLWVPPTKPSYALQGCFKGQNNFSKTLLFSSWAMVPRALSGLISYEAERRLVNRKAGTTYYKTHSPKIRFDDHSTLISWALVYPSITLAVEPSPVGDLNEIIKLRHAFFTQELKKLAIFKRKSSGKSSDWYGLAPFLLDRVNGHGDQLKEWLSNRINDAHEHDLNGSYTTVTGIERQLIKLKELVCGEQMSILGPMPKDLPLFLAFMSISGPGVSCFRSFKNIWSNQPINTLLNSASKVAIAFIGMINRPLSEAALLKVYPSKREKHFWKILRYSADGCFQDVIDEYAHLLEDSGLTLTNESEKGDSATSKLIRVFGIQQSKVVCQFFNNRRRSDSEISKLSSRSKENKYSLRCHYAVPLGNQKLSDEKGLVRIGHVRDAFNSPFRPFVLNSTSIGQEGLDFHWYCHHIVHWNIPSNPIDIEQREGRVNRYKSFAIRKRIVEQHYPSIESITDRQEKDVWKAMFSCAEQSTIHQRKSDLVPFWHIEDGKSQIERFVPLFPMSRDQVKFRDALKVLALYRLAFGQPRQEDLLEGLINRNLSESELALIKQKLMINLTPKSL